MKYRYYVGIDTGVNTGVALWDAKEKKLLQLESLKIHQAMDWVKTVMVYDKSEAGLTQRTFVRIEDARLRKFITGGREKLQGAGSIKRDAKIWEDFLSDIGADFEMVAPKNNKTKLTDEVFKRLSKWDKRTNVHARDAAMLVIGK